MIKIGRFQKTKDPSSLWFSPTLLLLGLILCVCFRQMATATRTTSSPCVWMPPASAAPSTWSSRAQRRYMAHTSPSSGLAWFFYSANHLNMYHSSMSWTLKCDSIQPIITPFCTWICQTPPCSFLHLTDSSSSYYIQRRRRNQSCRGF